MTILIFLAALGGGMIIGMPIIASGGVASLDDIRNVKKYEKDGVAGCIIGKAIYTGAVNLPDALKIAAAKEE